MQIAHSAFQSYRRMFFIRGIIAILFGAVVLIASPATTLLVLVYLFGAYAFISGIVAVLLAFRSIKEHHAWGLLLVEGLLSIVAGVVAFVWPGITAFSLLFLIVAWAIVTGITQIVSAFLFLSGAGYKWLLGLSGLSSVVFGILIALWPGAGLLTIVWLIGIYAIVFGVMYIALYFQG